MDLELHGKHALVTGASKGIGRAIAEGLASEGCELTLVARDVGALDALADDLRARGAVAHVCPADLSRPDAIAALADAVRAIDILVNNAGAIPPGGLFAVEDARWREAWDLKVFGFINLTRALYPRLAERAGVVLNIIGMAGETLPPDYIVGASGNAALMAFTRVLGKSAPKDGVRVVGINPGPVGTERLTMLMRARAEQELGDAGRWEELATSMPFGRFATPREIADAAAFLASPRSAYTSGAILSIHGGMA
ncbi:short-chain dehydrogenase/reductase [Sphingomonas colocasiae]|uniref:SDR family oxidoreductase n=1 Tax=Sphingomonas colocasiae TaxID=1848973 RepID=A0ABS7PSJ4_9SPHN|nr:short-chain dehydrogenase/reductase [Sphingomonas colocasiae]MBY8824305.1 SDR family oxidoreductase [Sphingomonas colocasiae]